LQSISSSIEAACRKTLQEVNHDSTEKPALKNSVKNYVSFKTLTLRRWPFFVPFQCLQNEPMVFRFTLAHIANVVVALRDTFPVSVPAGQE